MKRIIVCLAFLTISASATILVDEEFNYPDGLLSELTVHTGAGLTGMYSDVGWNSLTGVIDAGAVMGQHGPAFVDVINSQNHTIGDDSVVWMSYRFQVNGQYNSSVGTGVTYGPDHYRGIQLFLADSGDGSWRKWVPSFYLGLTNIKTTRVVSDAATPEGEFADLFLIAKVTFSDPPHVSYAVYDTTNKPTTEASIVWDIDQDMTDDGQMTGDYDLLTISQDNGEEAKFDDILIGDTFADVEGVYPAPTVAPAAPTDIVIAGASASKIKVNWTDTSLEEEGFYIERGTDGTTYSMIATNGRNANAYTDTGLPSATTYYYRVSAFNSIGSSSTISGSDATWAEAPPVAPSGLSASRATQIDIDLSWSDNSGDETGFVLERKTDGSFMVLATFDANTTSYSDTGLAIGETYIYRVAATNAFGSSAYTAEASATTTPDPVAPSSGLMISNNVEHLITFDVDVPGVYDANRGTHTMYNIVEPDHIARSNDQDGGGALYSESVSTRHRWWNGDRTGNNTASHFQEDGNLNGTTIQVIGATDMGVRLGSGATNNFAYKLSEDENWSSSGLYLRIKNTFGVPVTEWAFSADVYLGEETPSGASSLQLSYAVDGSGNPNVMVWTEVGAPFKSAVTNEITTLAGTINETVTTASVPDGGYIVIQIEDVDTGGTLGGSDVYLDNIGITILAEMPEVLSVLSEYGVPTPPVGINKYVSGTEMVCSVDALVASGGTNAICTGWSGTGNVPVAGTSNSTELITLNTNSSIVWNWAAHEYWLDTEVIGNGTVSISDGWQAVDINLSTTATADEDWLFMGWSGDLSGDYTTANTNVLMDRAKTITAIFSDDADGDGLLNSAEAALGTDPRKTDSDNDGLPDAWEVAHGTDPTVDDAGLDADQDGLSNAEEMAALTEPLDADTDDDILTDGWEVDFGFDPLSTNTLEDIDSDTFVNLYEFAMGGDPTNDVDVGFVPFYTVAGSGGTNCIDYIHAQRTNAMVLGLSYTVELTDDPSSGIWTNGSSVSGQISLGEGFESVTNRLDEPLETNVYVRLAIATSNDVVYSAVTEITKLDVWAAGYGLYGEDAAPDADPDTDGLTNEEEFDLETNPADADTDSDNMPDGWEYDKGLDPLVADAGDDPDSDTLTNLQEYGYGTHPKQSDTDSDGLRDDAEINAHGTDPLLADSDSDGMRDDWEVANSFNPTNAIDAVEDADSDGLSNLEEYQNGTLPRNNDTDNDGMPDGWEVDNFLNPKLDTDAANDLDTDYLTNLQEFQAGTDPQDNDSDDDGLADGIEIFMGLSPTNPDSDSDGMPDGWEQSYGLLPLVDDATENKDGDEHSNLQEFITGMSPSDPGSIFTIALSKADAGMVVMWPSFTNRTYDVQWADNLTNSFQLIGTNLVYPVSSYTDTVHGAETKGYYKVDVELK